MIRTVVDGNDNLGARNKRTAIEILKEGLRSADPYYSTLNALNKESKYIEDFDRLVIIGFGKASFKMALACEKFFGNAIYAGAIMIPRNFIQKGHLRRIEVLEGTHPIPSKLNVRSSERILSLVKGLNEKDLVICLISGGGSALFSLPKEGIGLRDKQKVTKLLLDAGVNIQELNCVRKHISAVKGGQLAKKIYPARTMSFIISDVVGDDLSAIASGPTSPDPSTFNDALYILKRHSLLKRVPRSVIKHLRLGLEGKVQETPKPGDVVFERVKNVIVANNLSALSSMANKALSLKIKPLVLTSYLEGEAREVGKVIGSIAKQIVYRSLPLKPPCAVFFGGETTVTVTGFGKGGRNQELALSCAISVRGLTKVTFASIGSDGVDGNSGAAGAVVDGTTIDRALGKGLDPFRFLEDNDTNTFFSKLGGCLIQTGPTGTNVSDLAVLLISP
jgi:glycerate-2-kinase